MPLTSPVGDQRLLDVMGMDTLSDSDGTRMLPSPAMQPHHPSPHQQFAHRPPAAQRAKPAAPAPVITLGSGDSASGPAFAPNLRPPSVVPYLNPPLPAGPPPPAAKPPAPGGHRFGALDPRDAAHQAQQ